MKSFYIKPISLAQARVLFTAMHEMGYIWGVNDVEGALYNLSNYGDNRVCLSFSTSDAYRAANRFGGWIGVENAARHGHFLLNGPKHFLCQVHRFHAHPVAAH